MSIIFALSTFGLDVTTEFGNKWYNIFTDLEMLNGLNINNQSHIWLLQYLLLTNINSDADFFAGSHNAHKIKNKGQASRTPAEMHFFDQYVYGIHRDNLKEEDLVEYGVDWAGLHEREVLLSHQTNNSPGEATSSWAGRVGPPPTLSDVLVTPPDMPIPIP